MKQVAKDVLRQAWMDNVRQIKGRTSDGRGGYCAMGLLDEAKISIISLRPKSIQQCPVCFSETYKFIIHSEMELVVHYNDDHGYDFAKIAELMPDE